MKYPHALCLIVLATLSFSCGEDETESETFNFPNSDLYPIYDLLPRGLDGGRDFNDKKLGWPTWSPDGDEIAFIQQADLWTVPSSGGEATRLTEMEGLNRYASWSPVATSNDIVFVNTLPSGMSTLYKIQPSDRKADPILSTENEITHPTFTQDGELIVFLQAGKKGIYTIPADSGEVTQVPNSEGWTDNQITTVQASPAENRICYIEEEIHETEKGTVYFYPMKSIDVEGGEPVTVIEWITQTEYSDGRNVYISPSYDGTMVAATAKHPPYEPKCELLLYSMNGDEPIVLTDFGSIRRGTSYRYYPHFPSLSPDGDKLVFILIDAHLHNYMLYVADLK